MNDAECQESGSIRLYCAQRLLSKLPIQAAVRNKLRDYIWVSSGQPLPWELESGPPIRHPTNRHSITIQAVSSRPPRVRISIWGS